MPARAVGPAGRLLIDYSTPRQQGQSWCDGPVRTVHCGL